jgi:hypothetical protein
MQALNHEPSSVRLRSEPDARVVRHRTGVPAYAQPHPVPVLPTGWAPLEPSDETAVLQACDEFGDACRLRLGSVWDAGSEYRVYCLEGPIWGGVHAATVFRSGRNSCLLSIARQPADAARVAIDFGNWDLEAAGVTWRLELADPVDPLV